MIFFKYAEIMEIGIELVCLKRADMRDEIDKKGKEVVDYE